MHNLFLLGVKHSGKTTFARLLAQHYSCAFTDSDDLVLERISPLSIREYYKEAGKEKFKEEEREAVKEYIGKQKERFIMSLGGGAAENADLLSLIKENGTLIYLKRPENEMLAVILKHGMPAFLDPEDAEGSFKKMYAERDRIYTEIADKIIDMGSYRDRSETLESLIAQLEGKE